MPRPSPQAHKLAMHQKTLQAGEAHVLSTRREELRSQLAEAEAAGVAAREALSAAKELRESLAARLTDFEGNRDERLKQSKAAIASAEKEAKASAKALEKAQQAEQKLRLQLQSLVDQTGAAEEALAETRKRSAEGEAELVEIEARVTAAKAAFDEATGGLKSHKEAQRAHEARLAHQIGERREALEQEVADAEVELKQLEHRCSRAIKEKESAEAMCRDLLSKNPWMEVRALARATEREGRGGGGRSSRPPAQPRCLATARPALILPPRPPPPPRPRSRSGRALASPAASTTSSRRSMSQRSKRRWPSRARSSRRSPSASTRRCSPCSRRRRPSTLT